MISLILYRCFDKYKKSRYGQRILKSLKAASVGLILSAAMTILVIAFASSGTKLSGSADLIKKLSKTAANPNITAAAIFAAAMILIQKIRLSPILVMALCGIVGGMVYS